MEKETARSDAGQVIVVLAVAMVGLLVAVGLAVDGGTAYLERRRAQNAADAAAREGARQLYTWQVRGAYAEENPTTGETALLSAVCAAAEANGIPDTDGTPGNEVNDNITVYYVDGVGDRLSTTDAPLDPNDPVYDDDCYENKCRPDPVGRCCGVEVQVEDEFGTALVRLTGPVTAPVDAGSSGVFVASPGLGGIGNSSLYALGSGCGQDQLYMPGEKFLVQGTAHTNDGAGAPADKGNIDRLEFVNDQTQTEPWVKVDVTEWVNLETATQSNIAITSTWYATYVQNPENRTAHYTGGWNVGSNQTGVYWVEGDMTVGSVTLSGLYYVEGDVEVTGNGFSMDHATIVATGSIAIRTDGAPITPWENDPWGVSLYTTKFDPVCTRCKDLADPGIDLRGNHGADAGIFYAPWSRICLDGDAGDLLGGAIIGDSIGIRGDGWEIRPWRPPGGAVGELERITLVR